MNSATLVKSIFFEAPREIVWSFLTDKDKLGEWYHPAEENLSSGASYSLYRVDENDRRVPLIWGQVLEMDPPHRLVTTFIVEPLKHNETTVIWELEEVAGGTRLLLTHDGVEDAAGSVALNLFQAFDKGWDKHFGALRKSVGEFLAKASYRKSPSESYTQTIEVACSPDRACQAIIGDVEKWWTPEVDRKEGEMTVHFGPSFKTFRLDHSKVPEQVLWSCTASNIISRQVSEPEEWNDTRLRWDIRKKNGGCSITLTHEGLIPALQCHEICVDGWERYFANSLKDYLNGGEGEPHQL
ncbi:SRPBCC family protein [Flexibacterium corallicola]|uniref:SRPBCC family protein n=1 Tax=Flexibacterium corallicola TaxID=3037259 RepID=UPI00286F846E|nr:SRPBCC family protein [Pseudovibrio sp. M1P-2-3]